MNEGKKQNRILSLFQSKKAAFSAALGIYLVLFSLPYLFTLPIDLMDIDTAQYGEIVRESLKNGDFLHLKDNGKKYLDKPILTFWTIGLSFKLFGVSNVSFRFPVILFLLASCWGIFKIALLKYENKNVAVLSAIIYLAIPGTYTFALNPTIDLYLNTYLILTHLFYYLGFKRNTSYYYLMYLILGMGFITKGPIGIVIPMISIGGDILFRLDFKRILEMKLIPGMIITSLLPGFWSYILYQDFRDFGPYFFLYLQSFGRFYMKMYDQGWNPFYFPMSFSWMFFTFIPLFIYGFIQKYKSLNTTLNQLISKKNYSTYKQKDFVLEFWLFLFLFLISFSKFRLPQYSFWNIPAGAILFSPFLYKFLNQKGDLKIYYTLIFPSILSLFIIVVIPILVIDVTISYFLVVGFFLFLGFFFYKLNLGKKMGLLFLPVSCLFSLISLIVYPELMKFQPASALSKKILELEPNQKEFLSFGVPKSKRSYEFYSDRLMVFVMDKQKIQEILIRDKSRLAIVPNTFYILLDSYLGKKYKIEILHEYLTYKIATPQPKFFSKKFRNKIMDKVFLIRLSYR
jgi:4-amino-4-deoxy-L-arabinose transferase-like glycosyltransferase